MTSLGSIGTKVGTGWDDVLRNATYVGENAAELLGQQVRFRMPEAGAKTIADVVPDSTYAAELWERPATRQLVQGVIDLAQEAGPGPVRLRGFSLSSSHEGYVLNRAMHHFKEGTSATIDAFSEGIAAAERHTNKARAVRKGPWLHLGPVRSEGLLHALEYPGTRAEDLAPSMRTTLGRGVKTIMHELDHVENPGSKLARHLDYYREGRAETFARWPGAIDRAGELLGIDVPKGFDNWTDFKRGPYEREVHAIRGLLELNGIDPSDPAHLRHARTLLTQTTDDRIVDDLATRIAARHATDGVDQLAMRERIARYMDSELAPDTSHVDMAIVDEMMRFVLGT